MQRAILIIVAMIFMSNAMAQKILIVENSKSLKRDRYLVDQKVSFAYDTANAIRVEGKIDRIIEDTITVMGRKYAIAQIYHWNKPDSKRRAANFGRGAFRTAGRAFFGISLFNGLTNKDSPVLPKQAIYALVIGEVLGLFFAKVPRDSYDLLSEKWQLKIVDFSLPESEKTKRLHNWVS